MSLDLDWGHKFSYSAIMSQHEVIFILKHSFQKLANFLKFVKGKCQKNAACLIISRPITVWLKNDHPQALRMLSYNTHDEVEGIIQEYSLHILLIIVKYLVRCIWLWKYHPISNLAIIMSYKYLQYHIYPRTGCREIG